MLAEIILKIHDLSQKPSRYYPRPSLAGPERCLRQMVYWAMGEEMKPLPGRAINVMEDSSWHEELSLDLLRKSAFHIHSEQMPVTISNAFPWMPVGTWHCKVCKKDIAYRDCHGHIDGICTDILGVDRLIEHKALSHFGFEKLWNGDELPYDYFTQMAIYLRGLQQDNPDLKEGILLIKNKNQSGYIEFLAGYDVETDTLYVMEKTHHTGEKKEQGFVIRNITENAFSKFEEVEEYRRKKELPERQYEITHWRCQYCGYFEKCWEGWAEEHKQLKVVEDTLLDGEVEELVKRERCLDEEAKRLKKEQEEVRERIKALLREKGIRKGRTTEYSISWDISVQKRFDKSLLPPEIYQQALKEVPAERLTIRKIKQEVSDAQAV